MTGCMELRTICSEYSQFPSLLFKFKKNIREFIRFTFLDLLCPKRRLAGLYFHILHTKPQIYCHVTAELYQTGIIYQSVVQSLFTSPSIVSFEGTETPWNLLQNLLQQVTQQPFLCGYTLLLMQCQVTHFQTCAILKIKKNADPNGRAVCGQGLQPFACWDCWIESRRGP